MKADFFSEYIIIGYIQRLHFKRCSHSNYGQWWQHICFFVLSSQQTISLFAFLLLYQLNNIIYTINGLHVTVHIFLKVVRGQNNTQQTVYSAVADIPMSKQLHIPASFQWAHYWHCLSQDWVKKWKCGKSSTFLYSRGRKYNTFLAKAVSTSFPLESSLHHQQTSKLQ